MRTGQTGAGGWQGGTGKMERGGGTMAEKGTEMEFWERKGERK